MIDDRFVDSVLQIKQIAVITDADYISIKIIDIPLCLWCVSSGVDGQTSLLISGRVSVRQSVAHMPWDVSERQTVSAFRFFAPLTVLSAKFVQISNRYQLAVNHKHFVRTVEWRHWIKAFNQSLEITIDSLCYKRDLMRITLCPSIKSLICDFFPFGRRLRWLAMAHKGLRWLAIACDACLIKRYIFPDLLNYVYLRHLLWFTLQHRPE